MSASMTDEEIRENLLKLGVNIGPVVDSTREFYRRKLAKLLGEIADEPVVVDDEGSGNEDGEATTGENEQWRDNLFTSSYVPPVEVRARRSIHANLERTPVYLSTSIPGRTLPSSESSDTSGPGSVTGEGTNTKLLCLMLGVALLFLVLYFYSPSTEVAVKGQ